LNDLERVAERYGVRRTMGEILDYVRSMALDILPRKVVGGEEVRGDGRDAGRYEAS
jgi:hypothetical protein